MLETLCCFSTDVHSIACLRAFSISSIQPHRSLWRVGAPIGVIILIHGRYLAKCVRCSSFFRFSSYLSQHQKREYPTYLFKLAHNLENAGRDVITVREARLGGKGSAEPIVRTGSPLVGGAWQGGGERRRMVVETHRVSRGRRDPEGSRRGRSQRSEEAHCLLR